MRKIGTYAIVAFILFMVATRPDAAAAGAGKVGGVLVTLANGAATVLGNLVT